jgi:preprotein translocase subunit SecA
MFKLFNKASKPKIIDRVFMHVQRKWAYCEKILTEKSNTIFIAWFDDTVTELEDYFSQAKVKASILKARTTNRSQIENSPVIFVEHYPMKNKEEKFLQELDIKEAVFLTAVDEPLLKYFGGERLITIMQSLGMKEDEVIEYRMISRSISDAQERIESKVSVEQSTRSQAEWMERNLK